MILELAEAGFLIGDYIYHRYEDSQATLNPAKEVQIPTTAAGSTIPLIYGRYRSKAPVLAYMSAPRVFDGGPLGASAPFVYGIDMFFVVGIGFKGGPIRLFNIWSGEFKMDFFDTKPCTGTGGFESPMIQANASSLAGSDDVYLGGGVEILNGGVTQTLVDDTGTSTTYSGDSMLFDSIDANAIPAYRGFICVFLHSTGHPGVGASNWLIGVSPQVKPMNFEIASYPDGGSPLIDDDVNPVDVIYDLLTGDHGKLGIDPARIDSSSFTVAVETLQAESHGFSRSWDSTGKASDLIGEVLKQIDGLIYEDPNDQKIHIKLIRPDYDVATIPIITPTSAEDIQNFAAGGWTDLPNKVSIVFTDRSNNYSSVSATAINQANALGQNGFVNELVIQMPGITNLDLANNIASRELAAQSRPLMKLRALVDRTYLGVRPGDAVMLNWPEANISRVVFRVVTIGTGTLESGQISLDMIQDYFYQWRRRPPAPPHHTALGGAIGG